MLKITKINNLQAQLAALLHKLQVGEISVIEYGDKTQPCGYMSAFRVYCIATVGGKQFRICSLTRGMEGSGDYTPNVKEASIKAMDAVLYYHRADGTFASLLTKPVEHKELDWFEISADALQASNAKGAAIAAPQNQALPSFFEGSQIVNLGE